VVEPVLILVLVRVGILLPTTLVLKLALLEVLPTVTATTMMIGAP
jgi:hypothetical protein